LELPGLVVVGNIKNVVEGLAWPPRIAQALGSQQQGAATLALALHQELDSFEIAGEAKNG
jgi:hypothetical protein